MINVILMFSHFEQTTIKKNIAFSIQMKTSFCSHSRRLTSDCVADTHFSFRINGQSGKYGSDENCHHLFDFSLCFSSFLLWRSIFEISRLLKIYFCRFRPKWLMWSMRCQSLLFRTNESQKIHFFLDMIFIHFWLFFEFYFTLISMWYNDIISIFSCHFLLTIGLMPFLIVCLYISFIALIGREKS